jgi:hypothetical protein
MKAGQLISLITLFVLLAPHFSFAQVLQPQDIQAPSIPTRLFSCSPFDTLRRCMLRLLQDALEVILVIALAFAALMIAWAGILYIIKGGTASDDDKKKIKNRLVYAAVGLVFAFLSWVIVVILARIIGGGQV